MMALRYSPRTWPWLGIASGAWLMTAPALLGLQDAALINDLLTGTVIVGLSIAMAARQAMGVCCEDLPIESRRAGLRRAKVRSAGRIRIRSHMSQR